MREKKSKTDFYDPRSDFPKKRLQEIKDIVKNWTGEGSGLRDKKATIINYWWLGLVDEEFFQLLHNNPKIKELFKDNTEFLFQHAEEFNQQKSSSLSYLSGIAQVFPELRDFLRKNYGDKLLPLFLEKLPQPSRYQSILNKPVVPVDRPFSVFNLLQMYPEHRSKFLECYRFTEETVMNWLNELVKEDKLDFKNQKAIAMALMIFPDLRPNIISLVYPFRSKFVTKYSEWDAFYLTIIGAEDAKIDSTGAIQLNLDPVTKPFDKFGLPERVVV